MSENKPLIEFPCTFPIKVMGINTSALITDVVAIVSLHCQGFNPDSDIKITPSTKGNYISVTATVNATSQQQLDTIYHALNKHDLVKFTL